jgi:hypothetical protein
MSPVKVQIRIIIFYSVCYNVLHWHFWKISAWENPDRKLYVPRMYALFFHRLSILYIYENLSNLQMQEANSFWVASHFSGIRTVGDFPHIYNQSKIQVLPYSIGNTPMLCIKNCAMCYKALHYCILFAGGWG